MQLADERTPASHLTWARNKSTTKPLEPKKLSEAEAAAMASQNGGAGSTWNSSQTWEAVLTRTPRSLRAVRTSLLRSVHACGTGQLLRHGTYTVRVPATGVPDVPWPKRLIGRGWPTLRAAWGMLRR